MATSPRQSSGVAVEWLSVPLHGSNVSGSSAKSATTTVMYTVMRKVTYAATRSAERSRRKQSGAPTANAPRIHGARVARRPWPGFGLGFGFGFQGQAQRQG